MSTTSMTTNDNAAQALDVQVLGIGLLGPGLADWATGAALLHEPAHWQATPTVVPAPQRLPPTERRRAGQVVKAGIVVADQACAAAGLAPAALATVFTSSTGDPVNCHALCEALATPDRLVSPTRFTNSVHNAPSGYWHIAVHGMLPSTAIAGFDASFGAGLLEAAVQCRASDAPVLLVAVDVPYPEPLHGVRPLVDTLGLALVLAPVHSAATSAGGARLRIGLAPDAAPTPCADAGLERLRSGIPAGRALALLQALASGRPARIVVETWHDLALQVDVDVDAEMGASVGVGMGVGVAPSPAT